MDARIFAFDGPGHGRQFDYLGGTLEIMGRDGRSERYALIEHRRGDRRYRVLAPLHTRNPHGLDEFIEEYDVPPLP